MKSRKGQLTLFIILGIILLIVAGALIYFYTRPAVDKLPAIAVVPEEMHEVSDVFTACIKEALEQSLIEAGIHGGFLNSEGFIYNSFSPTESGANSVQFTQGSSLILPYWWYLSNSNECDRTGNCQFKQNKPSFRVLQQELTQRMQKQTSICTVTAQQVPGYEVEAAKQIPTVSIGIQKETVSALVKYPLIIKKGGVTKTVEEFLAVADVNLREIFDLADTITQYEALTGFLGRFAYNLLNYYTGLDNNELPPTNEYTFEIGGGRYWIKSQAKEKVKTLLTSFVQLIKVGGSRNYQYTFSPDNSIDKERFELLYNREFTIPLEKEYSSLNVRFVYLPDWEPYFDLDCDGEICLPESFLGKFNFIIGIQKYQFAYDLSYPVLVEITNPAALNEKGYTFRFFLEGNLRANKVLITESQPTKTFEGISDMSYCDPSQFNSPAVELEFIDRKTKQLIEGVSLLYSCGDENCALGTADKFINQSLPKCIGGLLTAFKQNYATTYQVFDVEDKEIKETIIMEPQIALNANIKRIPIRKTPQGWIADQNSAPPLKDEHILIILSRQSEENEDSFSALVELYGDATKKQTRGIKLIPGKYNVQIVSMLESAEPLIIPKDRRCIKVPKKETAGVTKEKKCFDIPPEPVEFNAEKPFITSQFNYNWEVKGNILDTAKEITFTYPSIDIVSVLQENRKIEDLSAVQIIQDIVDDNKLRYAPKFT